MVVCRMLQISAPSPTASPCRRMSQICSHFLRLSSSFSYDMMHLLAHPCLVSCMPLQRDMRACMKRHLPCRTGCQFCSRSMRYAHHRHVHVFTYTSLSAPAIADRAMSKPHFQGPKRSASRVLRRAAMRRSSFMRARHHSRRSSRDPAGLSSRMLAALSSRMHLRISAYWANPICNRKQYQCLVSMLSFSM